MGAPTGTEALAAGLTSLPEAVVLLVAT